MASYDPIAISADRASGGGPPDRTTTACRRLDCARPPGGSACPRQPPTAISPTRKTSSLPSPPRLPRARRRDAGRDPGGQSPSSGGSCLYRVRRHNRGLFHLMFGPVLAERAKYPALQAATAGVETLLLRRRHRPRPEAARRQSRRDGRVGTRAWARPPGRRRLHSRSPSRGSGRGDPGQNQAPETAVFRAGSITLPPRAVRRKRLPVPTCARFCLVLPQAPASNAHVWANPLPCIPDTPERRIPD